MNTSGNELCDQLEQLELSPEIPEPNNSPTQVLYNDVIVRNIVQFLDLEDLKSFRLVSRKWRDISEAFFRRKACLTFDFNSLSDLTFTDADGICKPYPIVSIWKNLFFETAFGENVAFRELSVLNIEDEEDVFRLLYYFMARPGFITSLNVTGHNATLDMTPFLKTLILTKLTCKNCHLQLEQLISIENIELDECTLEVSKECKISPKVLKLTAINFQEDTGANIENLILNDIVNFGRLEQLKLVNYYPTISVSIKGELKISELELNNVLFLESVQCKWDIGKLTCLSFPYRPDSTIKELVFVDWSRINWADLPLTLERLTIGRGTNQTHLSEAQLPSLKYISAELSICTLLPNRCENLHSIEFHWFRSQRTFNCEEILLLVNDKIKNIKITLGPSTRCNNWDSFGQRKTKLEKLVLLSTAYFFDIWMNIENLIERLPASNVVVNLNKVLPKYVSTLLGTETLTVGSVNWDVSLYRFLDNSTLDGRVDKKSKFYVFEKQRGISINEAKFHKMCLL